MSVVYGESVSDFPSCFDVDVFSFASCVGVTQLISGFLFAELLSCSYRFSMSVGSCESGASHVTITDASLILLFLLLKQMKSESLPEQLCNPF